MPDIREPVVVRTSIPTDLLSPLERWYLGALFRSGEQDGRIGFHNPEGLPSFARARLDVLWRLVAESRQICPDLCARFSAILDDVEVDEGTVEIDLGEGIDWTEILRGLCRRDPDRLPFVEVEIAHVPTSGRAVCGGSAVFVHPGGIEWFSTGDWLRQRIGMLSLPLLRPGKVHALRG